MKRLLFFLIIFLLHLPVYSLDVVYPSKHYAVINAPSTFIFGNTEEGSNLTINSKPVKLYDEGIFIDTIPLEYGINTVIIKSNKGGQCDEAVYKIERKKYTPSSQGKPIEFIPKTQGKYLYTKTIKDNATIREKPSMSSKRAGDIQKGIILYLSGRKGDFYKIEENGEFWIHKSNIEEPVELGARMQAYVEKIENYSDSLYEYTKVYLSHPVLYKVMQSGRTLNVILYGTKYRNNENITDNVELTYELSSDVLAYEGYYEDGRFIFKRAKLPETADTNMPLKGIKIFIDAGHGGKETGAVGPTRVKEKDINLAIVKYLYNELIQRGADVSYSRYEDIQTGLYERVANAKKNNALISLSIHCNSLPNGKNPLIYHGTETHYYNENAKVLADIIRKNLSADLGLKDNGTKNSSFALTRSTNPISVLIETAYMINPDEYLLLKRPESQEQIAKSIRKSLEEFIILIKN